MGDVKSLIDGPRIDKHCFVYCGDDACTCSAGPNWHSPPVASPPASVEEQIARLRAEIAGIPDNLKDAAVALNELRLKNAALLSDRAAMAERVAGLERERDEALTEHVDMMWQRRRAEERAEASEAEVARLREALETANRKLWGIQSVEEARARASVILRAALIRPDEPTKET